MARIADRLAATWYTSGGRFAARAGSERISFRAERLILAGAGGETPALVSGAVNADSCDESRNAQCAYTVTCTPPTGLQARCDISFVGPGTRGVGASEVVFDVRFAPEDGAFTYDYISGD